MTRSVRESVHAKCFASEPEGPGICRKSKGHDAKKVTDPKRREHFDPDGDRRWM